MFLTESNMFGQKLIIRLEWKRGKEFTTNLRVMTDIEIFPTDETLTHRTRFTTMIKDVFHLIPRTSVYLNLNGLSRQRFWWRTDIGCTKSVRSQVGNIDRRIQEMKAIRIIETHRVGTQKRSDGKRHNQRRTKLFARKTQVHGMR